MTWLERIAILFGKRVPDDPCAKCGRDCSMRGHAEKCEYRNALHERELNEARERIERINDELSIIMREHRP